MVKTFNISPIKMIDRRGLRNLASKVWQTFHSEKCEISLNFVPIREIVQLNKLYLKKSNPTDVIAFNLGNGPDTHLIADIYICPEVASKNAKIYACELKTELARLVIHGMLHVIGYNDATKKERQEMRRLEDNFLKNDSKTGNGEKRAA